MAGETRDAINLRPGDHRASRASRAAGNHQILKYSTGGPINYARDELLIGCFLDEACERERVRYGSRGRHATVSVHKHTHSQTHTYCAAQEPVELKTNNNTFAVIALLLYAA